MQIIIGSNHAPKIKAPFPGKCMLTDLGSAKFMIETILKNKLILLTQLPAVLAGSVATIIRILEPSDAHRLLAFANLQGENLFATWAESVCLANPWLEIIHVIGEGKNVVLSAHELGDFFEGYGLIVGRECLDRILALEGENTVPVAGWTVQKIGNNFSLKQKSLSFEILTPDLDKNHAADTFTSAIGLMHQLLFLSEVRDLILQRGMGAGQASADAVIKSGVNQHSILSVVSKIMEEAARLAGIEAPVF